MRDRETIEQTWDRINLVQDVRKATPSACTSSTTPAI